MDLIITILPVVTKDLPISPRFTPYNFLSRCKFSTLTTTCVHILCHLPLWVVLYNFANIINPLGCTSASHVLKFDCSPGRGGTAQDDEQRAELFTVKLIAAEKVRAGVQHAVVCPNVIERTK